MEHISITAIRQFIEIHAIIVYFVILLGVIIEGEIVVIFAGIFSHLGSINILFAFMAVFLGGAMKSFLGYYIGFILQKHHSHRPFINRVERRISYFLPKFKEKPFWSIFISRFFILGIGWFTVLYSGYKKISLKIYIKAEALSLVLWSIGILFLGYSFSYTALSISRDVRKFIGIILIFFILFFILEKIIAFVVELFSGEEYSNIEEK
jgi:membrane protein DedA with SNARE-associated domain